MNVNHRKTHVNYMDELGEEIFWLVNPEDTYVADRLLYRLYALLALAKGRSTTMEDVHNAWAAWKATDTPDHRSLIPFDELTEEVQELDRKYMNAIHESSIID